MNLVIILYKDKEKKKKTLCVSLLPVYGSILFHDNFYLEMCTV